MPISQGWYENQTEYYMWKHFNNVCPALFKKGFKVVCSDTLNVARHHKFEIDEKKKAWRCVR